MEHRPPTLDRTWRRRRVAALLLCAALILGATALALGGVLPGLRAATQTVLLLRLPIIWLRGPLRPADYLDIADNADPDAMLGTVRALTAPAYAGRHAGSPANREVAAYLAERFAAYGLLPAGTEGYAQPFLVPYAEMTAVPALVITRADGIIDDTLLFRRDYGQFWGGYAGDGVAAGALYWLGDGSEAAYEGLDVRGQIVLVNADPHDEAIRRALEHQAGGLLYVTSVDAYVTRRRVYRQAPLVPDTLPTLAMTLSVAADRLLAGSAHTWDELTAANRAVRLDVRAALSVPIHEYGEVRAQNILGLLPGRDPALRDEVLVLGAHYDHVGLDPNGDLYAGANDNASGVAVLLEVARLWQAAGYRPDRTILFAAWDGEEQGLLGSSYYVAHPTWPLSDTVGMIHLDMVGLASSGVLVVNGSAGPEKGYCLDCRLRQSAALLGVPTHWVPGAGQSDHDAFLRAGVPADLLIWDNAQVPYYHTPQDTLHTLQPERLQQVAIVAAHAAMNLASEEAGARP